MRIRSLPFFLIACAAPLSAQDPAPVVPCRERPCGLVIDWGPEGTPTYVDRRYGSLTEFEARVVRGLTAAGYRVTPTPGAGVFQIRLRPRIISAMCDRLPGTDTDMSCRTIGEVRVDFLDADPGAKLQANLRIRNQCGADDRMGIERFSQYVAEMLDYTFAQDRERKRPTARC